MTMGIVILNYLSYQDTLECVTSIERQTFLDYHIVIVDNASTNESFQVLKNQYSQNDKISVVQTAENIGFAKGNNFGLKLLKGMEIYNCLVINGDTVLTECDYLEKLSMLEIPDTIGMIGTKIISKDGFNQNPDHVTFVDRSVVLKSKIETYLLGLVYRTRLDIPLSFLKKKISSQSVESEKDNQEYLILNPSNQKLHGSAIYFTDNYLKKYIGFYPDTFLYFEEELLALLCRKLGFKQMYIENMSIFHKEDASSDMLMNADKRKSALFKIKQVQKNIKLTDEVLRMSTEELKKRMRP